MNRWNGETYATMSDAGTSMHLPMASVLARVGGRLAGWSSGWHAGFGTAARGTRDYNPTVPTIEIREQKGRLPEEQNSKSEIHVVCLFACSVVRQLIDNVLVQIEQRRIVGDAFRRLHTERPELANKAHNVALKDKV
jgi:hypothetical protein